MLDQTSRFSPEYLDRKRWQLVRLQNRLRQTSAATQSEQASLRGDAGSESHEFEEQAQRLDQLERDENVVGGIIVRLARVERALEKLDEGTYGLSDISGEPIPEDRLDAMPDAVNTLTEQSRVEVPD